MRALKTVLGTVALLAWGCQAGGQQVETTQRALLVTPIVELQWQLPYGSKEDAVGLRQPSAESRAWGPQAAIISTSGELTVLDNEKGRVVTFDAEGNVLAHSPLSALASDLACSDSLCWFLDLATLTLLERTGMHGPQRSATALSAAFKTVVGLEVIGQRPTLYTAHQESYDPLQDNKLASRRSGLVQSDGRALSLSLDRGSRTMTLHEEVEPLLEGKARRTLEVYTRKTECDAVRLLGSVPGGGLVCLCDALRDGEVDRLVLVLDSSGNVLSRIALAPNPLYVPFRQVRMVHGKLLLLEPLANHLQVSLISLTSEEGCHE